MGFILVVESGFVDWVIWLSSQSVSLPAIPLWSHSWNVSSWSSWNASVQFQSFCGHEPFVPNCTIASLGLGIRKRSNSSFGCGTKPFHTYGKWCETCCGALQMRWFPLSVIPKGFNGRRRNIRKMSETLLRKSNDTSNSPNQSILQWYWNCCSCSV